MPGINFIAHRGESYDAPENTLAAVNLAWERGVGIVEVDVHLTRDGRYCVIHDADTRRTTGQYHKVEKLTLAQLQQLDAGVWKGKQWEGESVPSLAQVMEGVPGQGKLVIEIKSPLAEADTLAGEIRRSKLRDDQVEVISFHMETLVQVKHKLPQVKVLWLLESGPGWMQFLLRRDALTVIERLRHYGLNGIIIGDSPFLKEKYIKAFIDAGFVVYVYTVDVPQRARLLFQWGVEAITTNKAAWMKKQISTDRI